jgi:hypothetical protein
MRRSSRGTLARAPPPAARDRKQDVAGGTTSPPFTSPAKTDTLFFVCPLAVYVAKLAHRRVGAALGVRAAGGGPPVHSCFSEIARSGLTIDATYRGQIMAPWQRKLTTSPSATSNEC